MTEVSTRWEQAGPVRYPDADVLILDRRFGKIALGNAGIRCIATGFDFTEGPVWFGDGRGSSAFNIHIHMLGEGEIDNDDFTCFDKETVRYICR